MQIFFSVGEPSGDLHGANLIRELKKSAPGVECVGFGGPKMQAAGAKLHADLTQFAVMFFVRVLLNLHRFWFLYRRAKRYFRDQRPDAVVLIDYPGFNWWIARAARRYGIPVFYYGAPQMWAWGSWRVTKMRRLVNHTLCKLPFEAVWYNERGCPATSPPVNRLLRAPSLASSPGEMPTTRTRRP
jgi:lipid-A-disaccharide synthase